MPPSQSDSRKRSPVPSQATDAGKMRRLLGGDAILHHAHAGVSRHPHLPVRPMLRGQPLDEVVAVPAVLRAEHVDVALGTANAARIGIDDGITVMAPVGGIGRLELGQPRHRSRWDAHRLPLMVLLLPLAEIAPIHDRRHVQRAHGAEDVGVDRRAVAQLHRNVLLAQDARLGDIDALIQIGRESEGGDVGGLAL